MLMKQGDYSVELIAIEEGKADIIQDGKKVATLGKGDLIGEIGLLERKPRNADVIAATPMRVIKLTHWEIRRMSEDTIERIKKIVEKRQQDGVADPANAEELTRHRGRGPWLTSARRPPANLGTPAPG